MTTPEVAALVRAIRRAYHQRSPTDNTPGGVEMFTVRNIHTFAEDLLPELVREGVTVQQEKAA